MTEKQKLQKARAWFKFVLTGLSKPINWKCLNQWEREQWVAILNIRDELLEKHDVISKELGLNVPEHKCWCGKPAKHQVMDGFVCKKHIT